MNNINQCNEIILPVKYPIATSYTSLAPTLSILANYKKSESWVYNNFVNLWCEHPKSGYQSSLRFHSINIPLACPFLFNTFFTRDFICTKYDGIVDFVISSISLGYYVNINYDQYYIQHCGVYQKSHDLHQLFIFGFNKLEKLFHVADFFYNNKFSFEKISFDDLEKSTNSEYSNPEFSLRINKYVDNDYKFDIKLLIKSINDYLNSTNTVLSHEINMPDFAERLLISEGKMVFGIANYDLIIDNLCLLKKNNDANIDIRIFHALCDHKVIMLHRLVFMRDNGFIRNFDSLYSEFKEIETYCFKNRNLFIKYLMTADNNIIDKIIENIKIVVSKEKESMLKLLNEILF